MSAARKLSAVPFALALFLFFGPPTPAASPGVAMLVDDLARSAETHASRGEWQEACRCYDELFRRDRTRVEFRPAYLRCLRQFHLVRRHRDVSYRSLMGKITTSQALDLYEEVLGKVASSFVDRNRTDLQHLYRHGLEELSLAFNDANFLREHYAGASAVALAAFRARIAEWADRPVASRSEVREQVLALGREAKSLGLHARPGSAATLFAIEMACGACNSLDEYSQLLTPAILGEAQAQLRGRFIGIGADVVIFEQSLEVARVYPRGPAAEVGLLRRDRILRIDRVPVDQLSPEIAAERLRGDIGSAVELEVLAPGQVMSRVVRLIRRPVVAPSVEQEVLQDENPDDETDDAVGLIRIIAFQESTVQEVKEALAQLQTLGVRALVLDLRGNPGGLFKAALQVSELFLGEGVIVHSQSQLREYNRPFRGDYPNPCPLPLVVLIDGETASAAEVVAGALKDHERAILVGQATFGKGSIQSVVPLERVPLGMRITVARFLSPLKNPYAERGVLPDLFVEQPGEAMLSAARQEVRRLLAMMMTSSP